MKYKSFVASSKQRGNEMPSICDPNVLHIQKFSQQLRITCHMFVNPTRLGVNRSIVILVENWHLAFLVGRGSSRFLSGWPRGIGAFRLGQPRRIGGFLGCMVFLSLEGAVGGPLGLSETSEWLTSERQ